MPLEFTVSPRKVALALGLLAIYFAAQSLVIEYAQIQLANTDASPSLLLLLDLFSVNAEQTIPTWYSAMLLFASSIVLWMIATAKRGDQHGYAGYWTGLAIVFLYLSMDESAVIHEILADWLQHRYELTGYLAFGWQLVAAPLVAFFGLLYARFVFRLPVRTRNLFILAGLLYLGGTLVLDAVSANEWDRDGGITFRYLAIGTAEEVCEMLGVVLFLYALLSYIVSMRYTFVLRFPLAEVSSDSASRSTLVRSADSLQESRGAVFPSLPRWRWLAGAAFVVVLSINVALLYWASKQEPASEQAPQAAYASVLAAIDELANENVIVTRIPGRFVDNPASYRVVASFLAAYNNVMVITSISADLSFILAADAPMVNRDRVIEVLHAHGQTEFVIFDSTAVRALIGSR